MSPSPPKRRKSGGRPAGFVLPKHGKGKKRTAAGKRAAVLPVADPESVEVTAEALARLHPRKLAVGLTRVLAVLLAGMRRQRGLTQKELAALSRVSFQEIGQLERAEHAVSTVTLERICQPLGIMASRVVAVAERLAGPQCLLS